MLPTDLLMQRQNGEEVVPKRLPINPRNLEMAATLIRIFQQAQGSTQGELDRQLQELEGDSTDYRIKRGLAHLLRSDAFSTFEIVSPLDPQQLRQRVFALSAQAVPLPQTAAHTFSILAERLSQELGHEVLPAQIRTGLYADLSENRILTQFDAPTPEALLHRYNLSQVQGIFYKASQIRIQAHRNDPGEYKLLFRYLKLFGLMTYIEGDADHGFTISIDGPTSLFKPSTRYGLDIAKLLPALLHVTKWSLAADLHWRDQYTKEEKSKRFTLDSGCELVSHYPPGKPYDSFLELSFAERWDSLNSDWRLEREVDLIPIPGSVMIPDFRLVHPDGRSFLLEIVGYWRPEYLRKKFSQVRQSGRDDLILAISERLNLEKAGVNFSNTPAHVIWFKDKLSPKAVLDILEKEPNPLHSARLT
jgi:predicted nuclease of restriction endonuclease-like RecB superfamily